MRMAGNFNPLLAISDYFQTRKRVWIKLIIAMIPCGMVLLALFVFMPQLSNNLPNSLNISDIFRDFVDVQIGAIATLISFSIAIMTILVTADNENIRALKKSESNECKKLNKESLNLFQVLLSNITYNILVEIIYLAILIIFVFLQIFVPINFIKVMFGVCAFFLTHILLTLIECVGQMYLTFWKHHK